MRRAGFRYVFLGIENVLEEDLTFLKARAKNIRREQGRAVYTDLEIQVAGVGATRTDTAP
jgi:hypothetical protein